MGQSKRKKEITKALKEVREARQLSQRLNAKEHEKWLKFFMAFVFSILISPLLWPFCAYLIAQDCRRQNVWLWDVLVKDLREAFKK